MPENFDSWLNSGDKRIVGLGLDKLNEEFDGELYFIYSEIWRIAQEFIIKANNNA